ncbi:MULTISPECIES: AraC family transcriptional regulator [unclassified Pantoea]|uniref:AraC family transcriptional regulator n=1 Tax=unclassified Pantoea TaxID=2630326 RepID=UPI001CD6272C|nr:MULTISPECIES: AraC family transcriptional regulator [unclassified Pantoea]MCA1177575.1 AraC family transcriptional regulator [Pantoea sp. alder69]MCA1249519.1 AraC family transcriptional regulator [Pantoea sp. alder70]MCA1266064.1 AraC family transcriptional regulator [Pantoea sp. alder81]
MEKYLLPEHMLHFGLNIYQFGHEACTAAHRFGPAVRQHFLLHYVVNGSGSLVTEQGNWNITAGEAFLIFPHQITTYVADKKNPWEYMWLEVDGLIAQRTFELCGLLRDNPVWAAKNTQGIAEIAQTLDLIIEEDTARSIKLAGLTCLLFDALICHGKGNMVNSNGKNKHLDQATTFIERNYQNPISISDIAQHCRLDRSYLSRMFQQSFGVGPKQYLLNVRMNMAKNLLQDASLPIKVIACSVGYNDQLHFSRAFKQHFNLPPTEWRKRHPPNSDCIEL